MSTLIVITTLVTYVLTFRAMYLQLFTVMKEDVENKARSLKSSFDLLGEDYASYELYVNPNDRITIIRPDGTVLYDTNADIRTLENHKDRPEVRSALLNGFGEDNRMSDTMGTQNFYYALPLENGNILRVSMTTASIFTQLGGMMPQLLVIGMIVTLCAVITTDLLTQRLIAPMNQIDLEHPLDNEVYEELTPLLHKIDKQNKQIEQQIVSLQEKQEEFLAITENMKEALIIIDEKAVVLSMNQSAKEIFSYTAKDNTEKHILTINRNEKVLEAVNTVLVGQDYNDQMELNGRWYRLLASPVYIGEKRRGAVLLILDITEIQKAEEMRRDFSSNVSHELKTPLMSISGYAEIMMNRMVQPDDIPEFSNRIFQEAKRLTKLIEDIMMISKMDENKISMEYRQVKLLAMSEETVSHLKVIAEHAKVTLSVKGEDIEITAVPQLMEEIIYNLCDNAIKYNKPNGEVNVTIEKEMDEKTKKSYAIVSVSDTGIGIAKEHQDRIFERFYRVDKSHSRETGGTGLGLSIVKHSVMLHNGEISMESELGVGTTITVKFPMEEKIVSIDKETTFTKHIIHELS